MTVSAPADVVIVGAGVAGGLLALALQELGASVTVVDAPASNGLCSATELSYGALPGWPLAPTPLARLAAGASKRWRFLQERHGDLGWRPCRLRLHGAAAGWRPLSAWWPLPFSQVDSAVLAARLPLALAAAGVTCKRGRVERLEPQAGAGWELTLSDGSSLLAAQLVLAAGAHCRQLWPALPQRLRSSWAAALQLASFPAPLGRAAAWLPLSFGRVALERRAAGLSEPEWLVDGGLVPRGEGALLGQHTLVRPGLELGPAPPPLEVEGQLRQELAVQAWGEPLAALPGCLRQAAVAFCSEGLPLVGQLAGAPGLWLFTGFSAGFSQVPVLAPLLAQVLVSGGAQAEAATRRLQQLGLTGAF
ncbi:FAD-binding oxidoreductase [Cyanobium sp. Maggiore-St4-Cus]|uniref:FAD-dependent oxidoreductase n=1 Tax=Cyanobium sp. Maggiore-St4-Cus TaxID=2823717 RepID=UPI0020CBEA6D|nr:FAD-dependent oxidoreductase [Cyanobium sp. Maggiore-St4-Cus]MCP9789764.1 FAD-binding oxidoreductase [Cyanobium sp. Maggiore-St4-Cus]